MSAACRNWLLPLTAALLAHLGTARAAEAGWVTVRNDTNRVVVVQSTENVNGQMRRGKPCRLLPGESVREFHTPAAMKLEVFDGQNPGRLLHSGNLPIRTENQGFSLGTAGPAVVVTPLPAR